MGRRLVNFPELIQVKVTAEMKRAIEAEAARNDLPVSHMTRLVLDAGLSRVREQQRRRRATAAN